MISGMIRFFNSWNSALKPQKKQTAGTWKVRQFLKGTSSEPNLHVWLQNGGFSEILRKKNSMKFNKHHDIQFRKRLSQKGSLHTSARMEQDGNGMNWLKKKWLKPFSSHTLPETNNSSPLKNHKQSAQKKKHMNFLLAFIIFHPYFQAEGIKYSSTLPSLQRTTCERLQSFNYG